MVGREDVYVTHNVHIPMIHANECLQGGVKFSCPGRWYIHDIVQSELDWTILEEVQYLVGVINSGKNTIHFPPFGSLNGEVPPLLPFLCIRF